MTRSELSNFLKATLLAAALAGCSKLPDAEPPFAEAPAGIVRASFELARDFEQAIEVRATGTEDVSSIRDLWVIQMAPDGSALLQAPVYIPHGSVKAQGGGYRVEVELQNAPCKIAFVANSNVSSLYSSLTLSSTETDVAAPVKNIANESAIFGGLGLPMCGTWSGTPAGGDMAGKVFMNRACARVTFTVGADLPAGDTYELLSVQPSGIPNRIWYYRDITKTPEYPFPALKKNLIMDYPAHNMTDVKFAGGESVENIQSFMWYVPENARGMGTAADQFHKTAQTAPEGQGELCTYIELFGRYTTAEGETTKNTYRIYLGGNNTTDYNLLRNHAYIVRVTLCGQNASDMRVTVKATALPYTDNPDNSRFLISDEDMTRGGYVQNYNVWMPGDGTGTGTDGSLCPEGWRMPTQKELMLMGSVFPALTDIGFVTNTTQTDYASITEVSQQNSRYWSYSFSEGMSRAQATNASLRLRCVKNQTKGGKKYPYISTTAIDGVEYPVIISRDQEGGIPEAALLNQSQKNYLTASREYPHSYSSEYNRISPKFAVSLSDEATYLNLTNSVKKCPAGWRLPTARELMLIWVMGAGATGRSENQPGKQNGVGAEDLLSGYPAGFTKLSSNSGYYWSMTASTYSTRYQTCVDMDNGSMSNNTDPGTYRYGRGRCIKDLD